MLRISLHTFTLAAILFGAGTSLAESVGPITVEDAWSRAVQSGTNVAVGYLTIRNDGDEPDRLLSASAPFADAAEIHQTSLADGMMRMRPVPAGLSIPAKSTVRLEPNSYHLMFMGLTGPLHEGDAVQVILTFERAGNVEVAFHILGAGAQGPTHE